MRRAEALATLLLLAAPNACATSDVLPPDQRAVELPNFDALHWHPASETDLDGLYESVEIRGAGAGAVWKILYCFHDSGRYSGAALVMEGDYPVFQVLSGHWRLDAAVLSLDDGSAPMRAESAGAYLRLTAPNGCVVLQRSSS